MILAADVGGTSTRLGLFRQVGARLRTEREARFDSRDAESFEALVDEFLAAGKQRVHRCAVGVAAPIVGEHSEIVNLPWRIDARRIGRRVGLDRVILLNDLEATAWGIPRLGSRHSVSLTPGLRGRPGNAALIAAGTGLGTAILFWDGKQFRPSAGEGGHQSFAPPDDLGIALLRFLRRRHGRVSWERIVAGPGLSAIYDFFVENRWGERTREMRQRLEDADDPNVVIGEAGIRGDDRLAVRALDMFVSLYGAAAGDLALVANARAGVWIAGGIAPKILPRLRSGEFVRAFRDKGRLEPLVTKIPIRVIVEPRVALLGAAARAAQDAAGRPARAVKKRPPRRKR